MNFNPIIEAVGVEGAAVMAVCFFAVAWWAFRKSGQNNDSTGDDIDSGGD